MKILLATEDYWPNQDGGALFERRLVLDMLKKGHEVRVIAPAMDANGFALERDGGSLIWRLPSVTLWLNKKYRISWWPFGFVSRCLDEFKPDVVHVHNSAFIGFAAVFGARKRGIPVIATNHFMPENLFSAMKRPRVQEFFNNTTGALVWKLLAWFHNKATAVTSPTQTAVDLLVQAGVRKPTYPISNGVDVRRFVPPASHEVKRALMLQRGLSPDVPIVLYAGRLDPEKRLDILIAALPEVLAKNPVQLVFAGAGVAQPSLEDQARQLGVLDRVHFLGRVPDEQWVQTYQSADIFAMPSPAELQSIVTLEALACGLPVVATRVAALPEIVHEGENGFLFERGDAHGMAQAISKLAQDADLRRVFGAKSHELSRAHDQDKVFAQFDDLFHKYKRPQ